MLSKLFRYEMRYSSPILLFLHGFLLLGALVLYGIRHLPESLPVSVITAVGSIFCILLAACTAFYTYLNIGIRFYRTVFSRQGYLTNTLPVSAGQLLLSGPAPFDRITRSGWPPTLKTAPGCGARRPDRPR